MAAPNNPSRHAAKLSECQVREIRAAGYRMSARALGEKYGVHYRTVEKIRAYESWANLQGIKAWDFQ